MKWPQNKNVWNKGAKGHYNWDLQERACRMTQNKMVKKYTRSHDEGGKSFETSCPSTCIEEK
jgi:hypothetical protein